jgi:hypothetical protein
LREAEDILVWHHELEDKVVPVAYEAACKVCDHVHHAELRLENGSVCVIVEKRPTDQEQLAVVMAVKQALAGRVANPNRMKVLVRRGFRLMYTSHLQSVSQAPKHLDSLQSATRFTIRVSEIIGLRSVYDGLVHLSEDHAFVATVALGGVPGLLHLLDYAEKNHKPDDYTEWGPFYDHLRVKYHLFPGLLWSDTDREAGLLFGWMKTLPAGSSLLFFDTGTVGNGARRFLKVVKEWCAEDTTLGLSRITILGVVDGQHSSQKAEDMVLTRAGGQTKVTLSYHHVPRVLSEDCQELLGFQSVRTEMMYRSVNSSAIIEIISDKGEHIQSLAAMSGASAVRRLIRERKFPEPQNQEDAEDTTRFIGGMILCNGVRQEWRMIQNAVEFGLIKQDTARSEAEGADRRARETFEKDLIPHWDFVAKKKARPNKRTNGS